MNMTTVPDTSHRYVDIRAAALREVVRAGLSLEAADIIVAALLPHIRSGERMDLWVRIGQADDRRYRTCLDPQGDDRHAEAVLVQACSRAAERDADLAREARYAAGNR